MPKTFMWPCAMLSMPPNASLRTTRAKFAVTSRRTNQGAQAKVGRAGGRMRPTCNKGGGEARPCRLFSDARRGWRKWQNHSSVLRHDNRVPANSLDMGGHTGDCAPLHLIRRGPNRLVNGRKGENHHVTCHHVPGYHIAILPAQRRDPCASHLRWPECFPAARLGWRTGRHEESGPDRR